MSDSNTSTIDDKKEEENTSYTNKVLSFIKNILSLCLFILIYCILGSILLYGCKLAQSNILPTDKNCFPYTDNKPNIEEKKINIFTDNFFDPQFSMKINFPINDFNLSNKLLDMFRDYKTEPESNFLANYFISIMESLLQFNYGALNFVFSSMNHLPESIILIFGVFIYSFISIFLFIINNIYIVYLWFANMGWFFKTNNNEGVGIPKWEDVPFYTFNFFIAFWLVILFIVLFFIASGFLPIITSILFAYCIFSCLSYKFFINDKKASIFTIFQDVLKYYKVTIMVLFSLTVISSAFANLGVTSGIFSLVTIIFIYFGLFKIELFKPIDKESMTPIVDYEQAFKKCTKILKENKRKKWFFGLLGGGGKNTTKELKELNKKLTK